MISEQNLLKGQCDESAERKLLQHIESEEFGNGELALVSYNTAWVARISNDDRTPLFVKSLDYLREEQHSDGSWGAGYPVSLFDRIITTLIVVITLKQWNLKEDQQRIKNGVRYFNDNFEHLAEFASLKDQMTSGFEVLLPMFVEQAQKLAIDLDPRNALQPFLKEKENKIKMVKSSESSSQITTNKSWHFVLESFGESYPVEMLQKLVKDNALIASSYCSTAYALYRGIKSEESVKHLTKVVNENEGGVPSLFNVEIFDLAWSINSLIFSGFPIGHNSLKRHLDKLEVLWKNSNGILGAAIGSPEDSDDTANCFLALKMSNRLVDEESALGKLFQFQRGEYFITYEGERDPSLSSNLNCLITLNEFEKNSNKIAPIVEKVRNWTKKFIIERNYNFNDKWHMSKYYGMGRALIAFVEQDSDFSKHILELLCSQQRSDGGWGALEISTRLETSYAVMAMIYSSKVCSTLINEDFIKCLKLAKKFMDECRQDEQGYKFWIEKYLYCPINVDKMSIMCACYALENFNLE